MKRSLLASALTFLIWAVPMAGQDSRLPESGAWSVSATLPDGGGNLIGIWRMVGSRLNVGLQVDYRSTEEEDEGSNVFISPNTVTRDELFIWGPSVRYYLATRGPVAPFVRASMGFMSRTLETAQANTGEVSFTQQESSTFWRLAVGADWFPTEAVALGFFAGIISGDTDADIEVVGAGTITRRFENLGTFNSGIHLQLYF